MRKSPVYRKVIAVVASPWGLRAIILASAMLFAIDLVRHGAHTWRGTLDLADGPIFAALLVWASLALVTTRRRESEARADAEARSERLFRDAPVALFRATMDGVILEANPSLHMLLGVPADEPLVGTSTLVWYANPSDRAFLVRDVVEGNCAQQFLELKRRDGTHIWVVCTCRVVEEPTSGDCVFEGGFVDVSERRRATDRIRANERRYRALTEKSTDGVTLFGRDLRVTYRSEGALQLLGITEDMPAVSGNCFDRVHPNDRDHFFELVRGVLDAPGAVKTGTLRLRRGLNATFWSEMRLTNLLDDPDVGSVVVNFRDIEERVEAERKLRESEERFREMAEHIKESFFVTEPKSGRVLYVSPTWTEIWGRPIEEGLDEKIWFEAVHPDDRPRLAASIEILRSGRSDETTFRVIRPDKSIRWVRGRGFPVRDASGELIRIVGVSEDITELREAEARFTQAQKLEAVARLAGGVAHDFNNLLTVIMAEADFVLREDWIDPDLQESLENIRGASDRAAGLTRQLLLFSRRQVVEPVDFDLNDAVVETGKLLRRIIGEDVTLTIRTTSQAAVVHADRGQMEQVLTNLAVNARDAMPNGGTLTIATGVAEVTERQYYVDGDVHPGRYATLTVDDTGSGMSAEVLRHAFEPFFTTKERGKGTGLGLASCYGIIKEAGGEIRVQSEINGGTTFTIYLPLVASAPQVRAASVTTPVGNETILVVEDEDAVRRVAVRILRTQGYTVMEARDAAEAIGTLAASSNPVQLMVTDMIMPGMSGSELAAEVQAFRPEIRTLFVTGYTDDQLLQERILASNADLLRKPYSRAALAQRVRDALDRPVVEAATRTARRR